MLGDDGAIDIEKVEPIVFAPDVRKYFGLGKYLGKAFAIGKKIRDQLTNLNWSFILF